MSKIRLHGTSSGYTEIAPVAASGNNTLTLPNDGTLISKDSNGAVGVTSVTVGTGVTIGDGRVTCSTLHGSAANCTQIPAANIVGLCTSGLTKTGGFGRTLTYGSWVSVSGSSLVEFTSIADTTEFYIEFSEVGASTSSELGLSIGDTNGYVDSGYHNSCGYLGNSSTSSDTATNRFETEGTASTSQHRSGRMRFINMYGNEYVMEMFFIVDTEGNVYRWSGTKTTTAAVDRVKFFVVGGANFDQGYMRYVKVED